MMLDLEVQSTQKPANHSALACEVHRGLDLMLRPAVSHPAGVLLGHGEVRFLNAMRQLEDDGAHQPHDASYEEVEENHDPDRVPKHGNQQDDRDGNKLSPNEDRPVPRSQAGHGMRADPAGDD